jgi:hypothetical protein
MLLHGMRMQFVVEQACSVVMDSHCVAIELDSVTADCITMQSDRVIAP